MSADLAAIRARAKAGITYVTVSPNSDWPDGSAEAADADRDVLLAEVDRLRAAITQALSLLSEGDAPDMAIVTLREALGIEAGP